MAVTMGMVGTHVDAACLPICRLRLHQGFFMLLHRGLFVAVTVALAALATPPAGAMTAIYAQAAATGSFAGTYTLAVAYYSPFGLTVNDSGPLNGTSASYSPASAAVGLTSMTLAAAVNGNSSGSSTASVDLAAGTVRATAKSDDFRSGGNASAELYDDVTFSVAGGGSRQIAVVFHLDGTIGSFANSFSLSGLSDTLNFGVSNFIYTSQGSQSGFVVTTGGASSSVPVGWDSFALTNVTPTGFDFTGLVTISDREVRSVAQRLYLICQEGVDCDFSNTGRIGLQLPAGVTFTSGSGVFLSAVPEPASWAMLIAGVGLIGAATRRRRSLAAP
jgi:hypothetical protein